MESLIQNIAKKFGFGSVTKLAPAYGGFLSTNYSLEADGKKYFLKQYRFKEKEKIAEIHAIKLYFASKGIPVLLPLKSMLNETFFSVEGKYYALFPFVDAVHVLRGNISAQNIIVLGELLAQIHKAGTECTMKVEDTFRDKGSAAFIEGAEQILEIISKKAVKDAFDAKASECLKLKLELTRKDQTDPKLLYMYPFILIHGDFHENNVFFNKDTPGKVLCVFDFEKAVRGPRAFELWRSAFYMFGYQEVSKIHLYIDSYRKVFPMSIDEIKNGLDIYYENCIHSLWIEKEHYIKGETKVDHFLKIETIKYLAQNKDSLGRQVLDKD